MAARTIAFQHKNDAGTADITFHLPFNKLDGTTAPTANEDESDGFVAGSIWADRTNNKVYVCKENATGAAVWQEVTNVGTVDLSWKQTVRAASTTHVTLSSAVENGDTLDGVTLATGDRILIKNQSTATSTSATSPGTVANDNSFGTNAWSNPSTANYSNDSCALSRV